MNAAPCSKTGGSPKGSPLIEPEHPGIAAKAADPGSDQHRDVEVGQPDGSRSADIGEAEDAVITDEVPLFERETSARYSDVAAMCRKYGLNLVKRVSWVLFRAPAAHQSIFQIVSLIYLVSTVLYFMNASAITKAAKDCLVKTPAHCSFPSLTQNQIMIEEVNTALFVLPLATLNLGLLMKSCGCLSSRGKQWISNILWALGLMGIFEVLRILLITTNNDCIRQFDDALKDETCEPAYGANSAAMILCAITSSISFFWISTAYVTMLRGKKVSWTN